MNIVVLVKQVPGTNRVDIDPVKGTLKREGVASKTNPFDLYAIETALRLKERLGGVVTALSMGPRQAETVLREAYWMGVDRGILLSDRAFAGADTLATAYTLSLALRKIPFDLIIAGMQSTDGDTAQVGPGVAELLDLPHASYVREVSVSTDKVVSAVSDLGDSFMHQEISIPCLITVTPDICQPRLPSFSLMKKSKDRTVEIWTRQDLDELHARYGRSHLGFGLEGSPTRVKRIFPPVRDVSREVWEGDANALAERLGRLLREVTTL